MAPRAAKENVKPVRSSEASSVKEREASRAKKEQRSSRVHHDGDGEDDDDGGNLRPMIDEKRLLDLIPVSRTTLFRLEKAGKFPRAKYVSPNRRLWYLHEVVRWQEAVDEFDPRRGRGPGRKRRAARDQASAS